MSSPELQLRAVGGVPPGGICILGMHRSGTSLVAGLLELCGIDLGPAERLMEPKADNPGGFFEHLDIHAVNEHLLARLGGSWREPAGIDIGWEQRADLEPLRRQAVEVLSRDFSETGPWAFKDPRLCLLLPFWLRLLPRPRLILCVRNPLETAASLRLRDHLETLAATRLWALYNGAALADSTGCDRHVVLAERLLEHPLRELESVTAFLGLPPDRLRAARRRIESFVDRSRWHHRAEPEDAGRSSAVHPDARLLYAAIRQHDASSAGFPGGELDAVASLVFRHLRSDDDLRRTAIELEGTRVSLQGMQKDLHATRESLFETRTRAANLERWVSERERDIKRQELEIAKLQASLAEHQDRLAAVLSSLGWQLLDRYRRLKDRVLASGRWADRLYVGFAEHLRSRLDRTAAASPTVSSRGRLDPPFDVDTFATPPPPESPIVEPPAAWRRSPKRPPVVVAVVNWNRRRYLEQCVRSVLTETEYPHARLCVFDQGSTDGSLAFIESLGERIHPISAPENVGFVHAANAILAAFPGWDVVLLNNDTRVTSGWLSSLVRTAYSAPNIGLVGAKLVYPDGRLQEAGSQLFADGSARAFGRFDSQGDVRHNQRRVVDFCSGACLYVKRQVLERCGGLDGAYSPCYYEDADLCVRARQAGFETLYEPEATVIHQEYGTSGRETAHRLMVRNRARFLERWRDALAGLPQSIWQEPAGQRDRVLMIGDIVPAPDRSAGGSRLLHLLRILGERYDVTYGFLQDQMIEDYILPLERHGIRVFFPGYAKAIGEWELDLKAILSQNDYRFVICSLHTVAERYLGLIRQLSPQSRVLVDTYDVHYLRERRQAELHDDDELHRRASATRERELSTYARSDVVITVTEEDRRALLVERPDLRVAIVPTIHELTPRPRPRAGRRDLLFVGGFSHLPNVDAVLYFCQDILPRVRRKVPGLRLHVVGNAPSPEILALRRPDVVVHGYVPHLRPFLEGCIASVAPLRYGSGMKGKVAEAMAHGLPVVTTRIGAEGMALRDGVDAMVADDPEELAERIVALATDEEVWQRIAESACGRVASEWTPEAVAPRIFELLERAGA